MGKRSLKKKLQESENDTDLENTSTSSYDDPRTNSKKPKDAPEANDGPFEVEAIIASRNHKGKRQFKIRWKGCEESYDSWEYESELNCSHLIDEYLKNKDKEDQSNGNKKRKSKKSSEDEDDIDEDDEEEEEYEVDSIIDMKTVKGKRKFLIRWKGFNNESDTWEAEENLSCSDLINKYMSALQNGKKPKIKKDKKADKLEDDDDDDDGLDEKKEFEVARIIEVYFKKNGKREFLIRWKGFTPKDDTWEPEENLHCPELIEDFMKKVNKIKDIPRRELREYRAPTNRYQSLDKGTSAKRRSRRHADQQRVTYYSCEED